MKGQNDPLWNTVFAVATGTLDLTRLDREKRIEIKRACMAYAASKDVNLQMWGHAGTIEDWILESGSFKMLHARGTLQQCCHAMLEFCPRHQTRQQRMEQAVDMGLTDWLHAPGYVDRAEREELRAQRALTNQG